LASAFDREQITEEQVEALKDHDYVSDLMAELARLLPEVKEPLIDERDRYLMSAIEEAPGNTIVAVVGAGHVAGMASCFGGKTDRAALERVPPPSRLMTAVKWAIPAMILAAFYYGYRHHPGGDFWHMLYAWILPTALLGGLGTALAGGKPLSILSALLASPLTTLNPTIAAGMVVGLVEAWLRRPTVADCEKLAEDTLSWRGMYRNPFTRVLLVALGSTIGAALGAWVGTAWVLTLL
ncbi:MAG: TraB/GumN family protein, partial [Deltaproteobacteria bacterium]|nr:TraB/GumN family protein [Deltaproteobacteria bacterium]